MGYDNASPNRGGSGRYFSEKERVSVVKCDNQVLIDRAMAQAVYAKYSAKAIGSAHLQGDRSKAIRFSTIRRFGRDLIVVLQKQGSITPKQRTGLEKCLGEEVVQKIRKRFEGQSSTPEVLRVLPKSPPTRKLEE